MELAIVIGLVILAIGFLIIAILASDDWEEWKKEWKARRPKKDASDAENKLE